MGARLRNAVARFRLRLIPTRGVPNTTQKTSSRRQPGKIGLYDLARRVTRVTLDIKRIARCLCSARYSLLAFFRLRAFCLPGGVKCGFRFIANPSSYSRFTVEPKFPPPSPRRTFSFFSSLTLNFLPFSYFILSTIALNPLLFFFFSSNIHRTDKHVLSSEIFLSTDKFFIQTFNNGH